MSATLELNLVRQGTTTKKRIVRFLGRVWQAYLERRMRRALRTNLYDLSDRELMDLGTTRSEIEYIVSVDYHESPLHGRARCQELTCTKSRSSG